MKIYQRNKEELIVEHYQNKSDNTVTEGVGVGVPEPLGNH